MISIIIPVFNSEKYINSCLESINIQTYTNLEVLIIDDGSTDASLQICRNFATRDPRIRIVTKENGGQSSARNLGLDMATGDFVSFVDSDDAISADALEKAMDSFDEFPDADIVQFPVFMDYGLATQYLNVKNKQLIRGKTDLFHQWIETGNISWIVCNKVFRRDVFKDLRFRKMYYEDNYIVAQILEKINCLCIIQEGIYYYFSRENSTTTSPNNMQKEIDTFTVCQRIYKSLQVCNLHKGMVIMQSRILNISKSLKMNHKVSVDISILKNEIKVFDILTTPLSLKEKMKLIFFKYS